MKILDLDLDYFLEVRHSGINDKIKERCAEEQYGDSVWSEERVRSFFKKNLGLSKRRKIKGRVIKDHNEAIIFWKELIQKGYLTIPFEVIHVDAHGDLGVGSASWKYILKELLTYPVLERPKHNKYRGCSGEIREEGINDYLLFAIAYQWISQLTFCVNSEEGKYDYLNEILKDFTMQEVRNKPTENIIQLVSNPLFRIPERDDSDEYKSKYLSTGIKEPEVPMLVIPTIDDVKYNGDFDFAVLAKSPNYTPESADFVIDIFKEYIKVI